MGSAVPASGGSLDDHWLYGDNPAPSPAPADPGDVFPELWEPFAGSLKPGLWVTEGGASGETEVPPELGFSPGTEPVSGSCGCASAGPSGSGGASALALLAALGLRRRRRA